MATTEAAKHKELDLIQDVIKRQAANSFQVKTWMMGIVTGILAFKNEEIFSAGKTNHHHGIWISLILLLPIICFWLLDGFFLRTERLYRDIYQWVVEHRPLTDKYLYDLNSFKREYNDALNQKVSTDIAKDSSGLWTVLTSFTLLIFYLIPFLLVLALAAYNLLT